MRVFLVVLTLAGVLGCESEAQREVRWQASCQPAGFTEAQCHFLLAMQTDADAARTAANVATGLAVGATVGGAAARSSTPSRVGGGRW